VSDCLGWSVEERKTNRGWKKTKMLLLGIERKSWLGVCADEEERCWSWEGKFKARGGGGLFLVEIGNEWRLP
jgi:hypothetical protein